MQLDCLNKLPTQLQTAMPRFRYLEVYVPMYEKVATVTVSIEETVSLDQGERSPKLKVSNWA